MDRKVLIGLAIGAAALLLTGRRRRFFGLGGLAVAPPSFRPAKRAWAKGARIEKREHGLTMKVARRIAADHLYEDPHYYAKHLDGLGLPAVQHALKRASRTGIARALQKDARDLADRGKCFHAYDVMAEAEYVSGEVSAHATSTADIGTQKAMTGSPREQIAEAERLRKDAEATREYLRARCFIVQRKRDDPDPRQPSFPGV